MKRNDQIENVLENLKTNILSSPSKKTTTHKNYPNI